MARRALAMAGIVLGLLGLCLHFYVAVRFGLAAGYSLPGAIVFFFSFFTIQTNILAVLIYWASLPSAPGWLSGLRSPRVKAAIATAFTLVFIIYVVALQDLWEPEGAAYVGDILLHYAVPGIFLAWWLAFGRDGSLRFRDLPWLLVFPLLYFVYVMARAALVGEVPYPFLDYTQLGWIGLARSVSVILLLFLGFGAVYVLLDRSLPRPHTATPQA